MHPITLKRLYLRDWGPVAEADLEFPDNGVIALSGPCGVGKSHIIEAIKMTCSPFMPWDCATRETGRSMGEFVRNGAERAVVEAVYRVGDEDLLVRREVSLGANQPTAEIIAAGNSPKARCAHLCEFKGEKLKKEPLVTATLLDLFGLENPAQVAAVVVEQDKAGAIWRMPKSERLRDFQMLSGAERLASLNKYATDRADHFKAIDYSEDRIKAEGELKGLRDRLAELEATALSGTEMEKCRAEADRLRTALAENEARKKAFAAREKARSELAALVVDADEMAHRLNAAAATVRNLQATPLRHDAGARAKALQKLAEYDRGRATAAELARIDAEIARVEAILAVPQPRPVKDAARELEELCQTYTGYRTAFAAAKSSLGKYGESGRCPVCGSSGVCDKCGHATFDLAASVKAWKDDEARYRGLLEGLNGQIALKKAETEDLEKRWAAMEKTRAALAELRSRRNGMEAAAVMASEAEAAAAREEIALQEGNMAADEALMNDRSRAEHALREIQRSWDEHLAGMTARKKVIDAGAETPMSPEEEEKAKAEVNALSAANEAAAVVAGKIEATREALAASEKRVKALEEKMAAAERIMATAAYLADLRAASHPNALPRVMAGEYAGKLNEGLAKYCAQLKLPFTLELNLENLLLMLRSEDIYAPAAKYTSRGQFTMAAWAWTLALYHMHGNRCGFLALDEPNAGLDSAYRASVNELLASMGEHFRDRGLQMIVVSHDLDLQADVTLKW